MTRSTAILSIPQHQHKSSTGMVSKVGMQAAGPPHATTGAQCLMQNKSYQAASDQDILIASRGHSIRNMQMKKLYRKTYQLKEAGQTNWTGRER